MELSKEEIINEISAIDAVLNAHEEAVKQSATGIKVNLFIKNLLETELEKK